MEDKGAKNDTPNDYDEKDIEFLKEVIRKGKELESSNPDNENET